jgi:two-component SAPR family response regulator
MKKALIIDDEVDFCLLMRQFLIRREFAVEMAHTLTDGMKKLKEYKPDLIFLDNNLPDGTGWENVAMMINAHPGVRINLISAFKNGKEPLVHAQIQILEKPVTFSKLEGYLQ